MELAIALAAAGVLALIVSAAIIPAVIGISHRRKWYDIPDERKIHNNPIPRLGGIGIFLGLIVSAVAVPLLLPVLFPGRPWPVSYSLRYLPVFVSFGLIHFMGLADDFHNLHALLKFALQIAAASLVTVGGFTISTVHIPGLTTFSLGIFAYPVTVLWIVAISNAINLMDGIDGLAGGIAGISALTLGIISLLNAQPMPALVAFCLFGSVLGFLAFNFPPAKVFMGDSGSLMLGFVLAVIPLLGGPGKTTIGSMFAPATILLIPILDTISAIVRRTREKRAIYSPDRQHIHHKLLALDLKETSILLIIYGACVLFSVSAVASQLLSRGLSMLLLGLVWVAALLAFHILNAILRRRKPLPAGFQG
jgi:UDP-GlcNAc:undecaprenyl-phosphate/decaprenyl-phosphate GlcNAc-1-phosphate transferase